MNAAAFDNAEAFRQRLLMTVGTRHHLPLEEEACRRFQQRIERLENERRRAILLYPLPVVPTERPADPPPRTFGFSVIDRMWSAGLRWLKHPVAQWNV